MRRRLLAALAVALVGMVALAGHAAAGAAVPGNSNAFGKSRVAWERAYGRWVLGDSSNPLFNGECGDVRHGVFFMAAPLDVGVEFDCDVPTGMPIVFSHAAFYAWIPDDGSTDEEIEAAAEAAFVTDSSEVTVDGRDVPLVTVSTGAYDVVSEPGSAYDSVIGLGTGTIRTAIRGQVTILHPLTPGDHEVFAAVDFTSAGGGKFDVTYHIHVS